MGSVSSQSKSPTTSGIQDEYARFTKTGCNDEACDFGRVPACHVKQRLLCHPEHLVPAFDGVDK